MIPLKFPDAAELTLGELAGKLPGLTGQTVHTGSRVPAARPDWFVVCRRIGGTRVTPVTEAAQLAVECWAPTPADAEDLAQHARSVIFAMAQTNVNGEPIYRVDDVGGPADLPDELSDQPRASFTVAIHVRGRTP
jgi:hypothetical protein